MQTHGKSHTREYKAWSLMKQRCSYKNSRNFENWGGRGIRVCDEWVDSFESFLDHIGPKPSPKHSLDRIDNNGNYEPGNVRWATLQEQAANKSNTTTFTLNGITKSLVEWSSITGLNQSTLKARKKRGWTDEKCISTPLLTHKPKQLKGTSKCSLGNSK